MVTINTINTGTGTTGQVLTSNGTPNAPTFQTGSATSVKLTLSSSDIKSLNGTPIELIPAQGANQVIRVLGVTSKFVYGGSNVFIAAAGQTVQIYYAGTSSIALLTTVFNGQLTAAASTFQASEVTGVINNKAVGEIDNVAVMVNNPVANEITGNAGNDNEIIIEAVYMVGDLS